MSRGSIDIDMMELADLGQPTRIALEIHRQLRAQFGQVPRRMPLPELATAVGIVGIELFDGTNFEGTLVLAGGKGAIGLRRGMRVGRHNFTLAHEIGHFLIPTHRFRRERFLCDTMDMRRARGGDFGQLPAQLRIEVEANEFAAALIVPIPEYQIERRSLGAACDVAHIRELADRFSVSQEVMAKIYVMNADESVAIITSKNGLVNRVITPSGFPFLGLRKGAPLPEGAFTRSFSARTKNDPISDLREVQTHTWLEQRGDVSAVYEQVFVQEEGWVMTLLLVDLENQDEDADDRTWNRRSPRSVA